MKRVIIDQFTRVEGNNSIERRIDKQMAEWRKIFRIALLFCIVAALAFILEAVL